MTAAAFSAKWDNRFADNTTFLISEADLREFKDDLLLVFGLQGANVPYYQATTTYATDYLVRYVIAGQPESFFYSLQAGKLPAPTGTTDANWKVVPGPVAATALSQRLTLRQAQGIQGSQVVAGRTYLIDFGPDSGGRPRIVTVRGISNALFDVEGTLEVDGVLTPVDLLDVYKGTYRLKSYYTQAEADVLYAGKQPISTGTGSVTIATGQTLTLASAYLNKTLTVYFEDNATLVLPAVAVAECSALLTLQLFRSFSNATYGAKLTIRSSVTGNYLGSFYAGAYFESSYTAAGSVVSETVNLAIDGPAPLLQVIDPNTPTYGFTFDGNSALMFSAYKLTADVYVGFDCDPSFLRYLPVGVEGRLLVDKDLIITFGASGATTELVLPDGTVLGKGKSKAIAYKNGTIIAFLRSGPTKWVGRASIAPPGGAAGVSPAQLEAVRASVSQSAPVTADYTLALPDAGNLIQVKAAITITVPSNSSVPFARGTVMELVPTTASMPKVAAAAGVTVLAATGVGGAGQGSPLRLVQLEVDSWLLTGGA